MRAYPNIFRRSPLLSNKEYAMRAANTSTNFVFCTGKTEYGLTMMLVRLIVETCSNARFGETKPRR